MLRVFEINVANLVRTSISTGECNTILCTFNMLICEDPKPFPNNEILKQLSTPNAFKDEKSDQNVTCLLGSVQNIVGKGEDDG